MKDELEEINNLPAEIVKTRFLDCCGSQKWARLMTDARPFADVAALLERAEQTWQNIEPQDWLEAFAAHPKIGARQAFPKRQSQFARWSKSEQSGAHDANDLVLNDLAEANRLYEEKFGYIFIVCATGKSAAEMLEICRRRLPNNADEEIHIAADEQRKITEIRLKKLLEVE